MVATSAEPQTSSGFTTTTSSSFQRPQDVKNGKNIDPISITGESGGPVSLEVPKRLITMAAHTAALVNERSIKRGTQNTNDARTNLEKGKTFVAVEMDGKGRNPHNWVRHF